MDRCVWNSLSYPQDMERRAWVPALAAAVVVAALGVAGSVVRQPWHDELYSLHLAGQSAPDILEALRVDSGPPGHYLVCRAVYLLGGQTVFWLRLPSVLAACLAAFLVVVAAARLGPRTAWAAAALTAFHPLLLAAAVEARGYALLLAAAAAVSLMLASELGRRRAVGLALLLAAACWSHSLGVVLTGAVAVAAAAWDAASRRRAWLAVVAALASHLPWVPVMAAQPEASLVWMQRGWEEVPQWLRWLLPAAGTSPVSDVSLWVDLPPAVPAVVAVGALLWLALVAGAGWRRSDHIRLLLLWASAGLVLVVVSVVARPVYAPGRAEMAWLPAALLLAAAGGVRWRRWGVSAVAVLAGAGALVGIGAISAWASSPPPPEQAVARALAGAAPGDVVVTTGWWSLRVRHALGGRAGRLDWRSWPPSAARHPGWYDDGEALLERGAADELACELSVAQSRGAKVWLVRSPGLASDRLLDLVAGRLGLMPRAGEAPLWEVWGPPDPQPPAEHSSL